MGRPHKYSPLDENEASPNTKKQIPCCVLLGSIGATVLTLLSPCLHSATPFQLNDGMKQRRHKSEECCLCPWKTYRLNTPTVIPSSCLVFSGRSLRIDEGEGMYDMRGYVACSRQQRHFPSLQGGHWSSYHHYLLPISSRG